MKYYVIEIAEGNEKIAGKSVYEYDNKPAAIGAFHAKLGTAYKSELYTFDLVMVIDSDGNCWATEKVVK